MAGSSGLPTGGSLQGLYQQVILDHAKQKHGHGLREPVLDGPHPVRSGESRQYNPLCGDEVTLRVAVSGAEGPAAERRVQDLSWTGEGCSISQAATSVLYDLVVGHPVDEALRIVDDYREMLRSRGLVEPDEDVLGDAVAFAGVGRHANRVKCAILGWTAFEDALLRTGADAKSGTGTTDGEVR
jgi:nitrogen fixation NifU-like protein